MALKNLKVEVVENGCFVEVNGKKFVAQDAYEILTHLASLTQDTPESFIEQILVAKLVHMNKNFKRLKIMPRSKGDSLCLDSATNPQK